MTAGLLGLLLASGAWCGSAARLRTAQPCGQAAQPTAPPASADSTRFFLQRAQRGTTSEAPTCLTAGLEDRAGGVSLYWHTCQDGHAAPWALDPAVREAQFFLLEPGGQLRANATRLCVRRALCGQQPVYDLGKCDGPGRISEFLAWRSQQDGPWRPRLLGYPWEAVERDHCDFCGPYLLVERCRSEGGTSGTSSRAGGCGQDWRAAAGWTKMPFQYVGEAAVEGRVERRGPARDLLGEIAGLFGSDVAEMSGLGGTGGDGICGSYVADGPRLESIFYLRRA